MDADQFKEAARQAVDDIVNYYATIADRSVVSRVEPGYLRKLLPEEAPQHGEPWADIQRDIEDKIMPGITHWQSPNFFAFFPCPSTYPSMLGELWSSALGSANFNWICSPAVTELETVVLDWLARLLGLPECYLATGPTGGGGVIHGSASEAVLTVMVAARDKHLREALPAPGGGAGDGGDADEAREEAAARLRGRLVALGSAAAHSSTRKAARILGVRYAAVPVRAEDGYAMTGAALRATLAALRARGLAPFFLTATLGTTDTCAVDDFAGVAAALAGDGGRVWAHVDAAYAGAALVTPEARAAAGVGPGPAGPLAAFHSFNTNMHKWLLTNFDASCLFVRDRRWLADALAADQHVYHNGPSAGGLVTDYRDWQIPLGRRFRSLKAWFVLRAYGAEGLRAHVRRTTALGALLASLLRGRPDLFELAAPPRFALTVFRVPGAVAEGDAPTRRVYDEVNASGRAWTTSTVLDGRLAIRVMTANRLTEEGHVRAAFALMVAAAERALESGRGGRGGPDGED